MMRKLLLIFILFTATLVVHSQDVEVMVDAEDNMFQFDLSAVNKSKTIGYSVVNNTDTTLTWYWEIVTPEGFPSDWNFQVCDSQLCYNIGKDRPTLDNVLASGSGTSFENTYVKVETAGSAGSSYVIFKIYDNDSYENPIYVSNMPSATVDVQVHNLKLYPNPAVDYIQIENDNNVASLVIQNIVGSEIKRMSHYPTARHSVRDLENGMYLVRLLDANGKNLKTMRLSKR